MNFRIKLAALILLATPFAHSAAAPSCADLLNDRVETRALVKVAKASRPKIVLISGPSGSGKTTLMEKLTQEFPAEFRFSVSTTTRAPRGQEVDGKDYHFVTQEKFQELLADGQLLESAQFAGNFYGTAKASVEKIVSEGRTALLLVDIQGANQIRQALPGQTSSIFISPPDLRILEARLRARGTDSDEAIQKRLSRAREEVQNKDQFDQVIVNDDLDRAYEDLQKVLGAR